MSPKPIQNLPASVLARLRDRARRTGGDYQVLLGALVCERFLYRLGVSNAADRFVLKGAMLLRVVGPEVGKPILGDIRPFLLPILDDLRLGVLMAGTWVPGGPWR